MIKGIKASEGIAIGKAFIYNKPEIKLIHSNIHNKEEELKFFNNCIEKFKVQLNNFIDLAVDIDQKEKLNTYLMLIESNNIENRVKDKIKYGINTEIALTEVVEEIVQNIKYVKENDFENKIQDLEDVYKKLIYIVKGIELKNFEQLEEGSIIIADDLLASDTVKINLEKVSGFATNLGGKTSHTVIVAKNMDIPCVVGMKKNNIKDGDTLIIDGYNGVVHINPKEHILKYFKRKKKELAMEAIELEKVIYKETKTKCNKKITLSMNCGSIEDVKKALERNADSIGLFRTEFLYMQSNHFPKEEEQFNIYKEILTLCNEKSVVVRTLDIGGDKNLPYYEFEKEENPFLGLRGIRLCLKMRDIFKTQLRALLRASVYGNLEIIIPMVVSVEEIDETKKIIEEIKLELRNENLPFKEDFKIGIMIETPASVIIADELAKNVDFFSIGTNDLTQYILSTDRGNENVSYLYDTTNLAVLRAIQKVIIEAEKNNIDCSMCGEFAGDERYTDLLLNIGLKKFSVGYSKLPKIKNKILNTEIDNNFKL